jgi:hypothetical protein
MLQKDVLKSKFNVKSKFEIKMGLFHLKKQRWRQFTVFPEVPPFENILFDLEQLIIVGYQFSC